MLKLCTVLAIVLRESDPDALHLNQAHSGLPEYWHHERCHHSHHRTLEYKGRVYQVPIGLGPD